MKTIRIESVNFYGENWQEDLIIPDDMVFVECSKYYNHKLEQYQQRFYAALYPYDETYYNQKHIIRESIYNINNEFILIQLHNCFPVNEDIPLIDFEELNTKWLPIISPYIFVSEKFLRHKVKVDFNDTLLDVLKIDDIFQINSMSKVLEFIPGGETLQCICSYVGFKNLFTDFEDNTIRIDKIQFSSIIPTAYISGDLFNEAFKDEETQNKFNERVKEIFKKSGLCV